LVGTCIPISNYRISVIAGSHRASLTRHQAKALSLLLPHIAKDRRFSALQDYHPPEGPLWARAAVADWLNGVAGGGDAGRVVLTDGAQHGLACVSRALTQPDDVVLADSITYQGISALCRSQGVDLRGVSIDREGMRPDAFEAACSTLRPRAVFLVPSLHNPTTVTLSEERRRALAAIARRHNVLIIEDDVYRPLLDRAIPSFATLEPELTVHISGLSKCIAPGLRYGFVVAPRAVLGNVAAALRIDCWSISPLTALVATILLEEGTAKRIIEFQREELRRRQAILRDALAAFDVQTQETSPHAWLHLPEPWRGAAFARACRQRGVLWDAKPSPMRCVSMWASGELRQALSIMADLLNAGHLEISGAV
jgi:DNA-binding transcriptional MocR family regulator